MVPYLDEEEVYSSEALEAHRVGSIFIHKLDRPFQGYSTGVDLEGLGDQSDWGTLDRYLAYVADIVNGLRREWVHRVTLYGLEASLARVINKAGYTEDQIRRSFASFIHELDHKEFHVTLSLNNTRELHISKQVLAETLEAEASIGRINVSTIYSVADDTELSKEPHSRFVSLACRYGNVEFQGETPTMRTGVLGDPTAGGRLGIVTLNLPRLGYEARNEEDFYVRLDDLIGLAVEALEDKRRAMEKLLGDGRLPNTGQILVSLSGHVSVVTLSGVNEAIKNLIDADISQIAGKAVAYKVLEFTLKQLQEAQRTTGHCYSLEAYPSMEAGVFFAAEDRRLHNDIYTQGKNTAYYTAAADLPSFSDDLWGTMEHLKRIQSIFSGGTTQEVHLEEGLSYRDECGLLVKRIMGQGYPNVKFSPVFSVCPNHGYISGEAQTCPLCSEQLSVYSWVDGYPRNLSLLSDGLKEAHRQRVSHDVKSR